MSDKQADREAPRLYDLLRDARTAPEVTLYFKDGRVLKGQIIFNSLELSGRLVNLEQEILADFTVDQLMGVKF